MPSYINRLKAPEYVEQAIMDGDGALIGTLRIKPSGILWKPSGKHKFYVVSWDRFSEWITGFGAKARLVKQ